MPACCAVIRETDTVVLTRVRTRPDGRGGAICLWPRGSIPPDRQQTVLLSAHSQRPVHLVLVGIDVDFNAPVLVVGHAGQFLGRLARRRQEEQGVGVPKVVR